MSSRKTRVHFYADECIPMPTITYLRSKGIIITHAFDKGYIAKADSFHLRQSQLLKLVLISLDKDFKKFKGTSLDNHPGVILISSSNVTPKHLNMVMNKILKHVSSEYLKGSLVRASIDKISREKLGVVVDNKII